MNIGVIGMGGLGTMHFSHLVKMPGVCVTDICDVRPEQMTGDWSKVTTNLGRQGESYDLGAIAKHADYRKLLEKDIQAVVIATPTFLHAEMAIAAMEAGKHVFSEKPMALNAEDSRRMADAARRTGRTLQIGHVLRFWPEYIMTKEMIDDRRYGAVRSVWSARSGGFPLWAWNNWFCKPELSGGAMVDMHVHDVDVINWWFGMPKSVFANGVPDGPTFSQVVTQYQYDNVPQVTTECGWTAGPCPFQMSFVVSFEKATVVFGLGRPPGLSVYETGTEKPQVIAAPGDAYLIEKEYFFDCIAKGVPNSRLSPDMVVKTMDLLAAELASAKSGQVVRL